MLVSLTIKNVVLIRELFIEFGAGFCALTGETGAGKSILLDSLGLALGARSDSGLVRKGEEQAIVSAEFQIGKDHPVLALLAEQGLEGDQALVLRRIVSADGRSRAFINDQPVSVGLLREAGEMLVEIHGQFETQGLLDPKTHKGLLDDFAGISPATLRALWEDWKQAKTALITAQEKAQRARTEEDYLRTALEDLDALDPQEGEEEKLSGLRDRLMRREQVLGNLSNAHEAMNVAEDSLFQGYRALEKVGEDAGRLLEALDRASAEIQEVRGEIEAMCTDLEESEHSLATIDDRLFALRGQARKHNCTVDELPRMRDDLAQQLSLIERSDEVIGDLRKAVDKARDGYVAAATKTRAQRQEYALKLDELVAAELPPLKLDKARFVTAVEDLPEEEWGPSGMDRVRFLVATNPGAEPGALNRIASGGEMARFMLALKVVMAAGGGAGSYVFDEVDSGIGGSTAAAVGERLRRLAAERQILVVTHSPQVAAQAGHHLIVMKDGGDDMHTTVVALEQMDARQDEIARMLSGAEITEEARAAAGRLLQTGT